MPLVAAAVCPYPPAVIPELAAGAAPGLDDLRAACAKAVGLLRDSGAGTIVVVGGDSSTREHDPPFHGSFAPWGVPIEVRLGPAAVAPEHGPAATAPANGLSALPLGLLVGARLLQQSPTSATYQMISVGADADADGLGARLARRPEPWALLVMGDGSARRGVKAPGYDDPRAQPYDDRVAAALAGADAEALRDLDPDLSARLLVAGRAPWQVMAGAVLAAGGDWRGDLSYYAAPYGVAYFVASWTPA